MKTTTTRMSDVVAMMRDESAYDALVYRGVRFVRAYYRGAGGGHMTVRAAKCAIRERLNDEPED